MTTDPASVLVVDDEPSVAEAYSLWLEADYDVTTAGDGEAALERIGPDTDVVLLDRRMPVRSGDEVLSAIRDRGLDCRVAMVTAVDPGFDIVDMPFDDYLTKPVTREELRDTVARLLALREYDEAVHRQFSLVRKCAALRAEKPTPMLRDSDRYRNLESELEAVASEAETAIEEMDHETLKVAMADLLTDRHHSAE